MLDDAASSIAVEADAEVVVPGAANVSSGVGMEVLVRSLLSLVPSRLPRSPREESLLDELSEPSDERPVGRLALSSLRMPEPLEDDSPVVRLPKLLRDPSCRFLKSLKRPVGKGTC